MRIPPTIERAIANAEGHLGKPWIWNGRDTPALPGLDCLGIIFVAYGDAWGVSWRSFPVEPSKLVASGKLGAPVPGLRGVTRKAIDPSRLQRGDIVYFLVRGYEIPDEPLLVDGTGKYWPWHTGIYVGEGRVLNSHPEHGVVFMDLGDIAWDALYVTRPRT